MKSKDGTINEKPKGNILKNDAGNAEENAGEKTTAATGKVSGGKTTAPVAKTTVVSKKK